MKGGQALKRKNLVKFRIDLGLKSKEEHDEIEQ